MTLSKTPKVVCMRTSLDAITTIFTTTTVCTSTNQDNKLKMPSSKGKPTDPKLREEVKEGM